MLHLPCVAFFLGSHGERSDIGSIVVVASRIRRPEPAEPTGSVACAEAAGGGIRVRVRISENVVAGIGRVGSTEAAVRVAPTAKQWLALSEDACYLVSTLLHRPGLCGKRTPTCAVVVISKSTARVGRVPEAAAGPEAS